MKRDVHSNVRKEWRKPTDINVVIQIETETVTQRPKSETAPRTQDKCLVRKATNMQNNIFIMEYQHCENKTFKPKLLKHDLIWLNNLKETKLNVL